MRIPFVILILTLLFTACGKDSPTGPRGPVEPEITNTEGRFTFKAYGFNSVTETITYEWLNPTDIAAAEMNGRIDWGAGTLIISDGVGNVVFTFDLDEEGAYLTDVGVPGSWTIRIDLANASGDIDLIVTTVE